MKVGTSRIEAIAVSRFIDLVLVDRDLAWW